MTVHVVVSYRLRLVEVEVAIEDPEACVADLTSGLDGGRNELGLVLDGRWFGPDIGLGEIGLYEGAVVEIAPRC